MTILEQMASLTSPILADMIESHRESHEPDATDTPQLGPKFDNRPTWDNWKKKDPPWSKKRTYFRDR